MAIFGGKKKKKGAAKASTDGKTATADADAPPSEDAKLEFPEKDISAARKWFAQADKLNEDRNYDYAIESYLTGLERWPEAVEEGHQKLRVAGYARWEKGGKKPGTIEVMKHSMSGRDPRKGMINAAWLWARDPINVSYMEGLLKNAAKGKFEQAALFIAPIYFEAIKREKKLSKDRFLLVRKIYEDLGNRCERRADFQTALVFYQGAYTVVEALHNMNSQTREYAQELTDMATKITIIRGKYDTTSDFRGSLKDSGAQKDIHDRERMVVDRKRLAELIEDAKQEWRDNPDVSAKLLNLVDLLCKEEKQDSEDEAVETLDAEFAKSENYSFKMRADDIRMKQTRRKVRRVAADGDKKAVKAARLEQVRQRLSIFEERVKKYPTEHKLKYDFGKQLMLVGKYDEAIPLLQAARNDPKSRIQCMNLIARCFYEKGFYTQAISQYNQAIQDYELAGDDLSKELYYWLGRTHEKSENVPDAEKAYGQLIQWDYNFRDVRQRLADLEQGQADKG